MIHIFNPEHDIALAAHLAQFTAPHAGRQLRHDLGYLPTLWAHPGDLILTDDSEAAREAFRHLGLEQRGMIVDWNTLPKALAVVQQDGVSPWGWDLALRHRLLRAGLPQSILPTPATLNTIRLLSNRGWAAIHLLPILRQLPFTVGEALELKEVEGLKILLRKKRELVVKAPWSSSGRGVRYLTASTEPRQVMAKPQENWVEHVMARQGGIMVEPRYDKVVDFGMEFYCDKEGTVTYKGLSLFKTANAAYTGSIVDTEEHKLTDLARYVDTAWLSLLRNTLETLLTKELGGVYHGPLGIDMMIVHHGDGLAIHPCVEMNLRRTMGHVALCLPTGDHLPRRIMQITYTDKYRLRINKVGADDDETTADGDLPHRLS